MKRNNILKVTVCLLLALVITLSLASCGKDRFMTLDSEELSFDVYKLMLSIQKGNMAYLINYYYGDYNSADFWDTVIDESSTTNDEYYTFAVYKRAKNLLSASAMFNDKGLSLSDNDIKSIDSEIDALIKEFGGGDEKALDAVLSAYGISIDTIREYKALNLKAKTLAKQLYGANGEKIGTGLKDAYFNENYVSFKQILIASYYPVYKTDANGDVIYYDGNGSIAYKTEGAIAELGDDGKIVYYTEDGKISYDKESGVPSPVLDENGYQETADYGREELLKRAEQAIELSELAGESEEVFDALAKLYSDDEASAGVRIYLATNVSYSSINQGYAFFDNVAERLAGMNIGEVTVYQDELGFHVIMKCALEDGAYAKNDYSPWFTDQNGVFDFSGNLENELFNKALSAYHEGIEVDEDTLNSFTLRDAVPNYYYH